MKLNLGCADRHLKGCTNVDRVQPADQIVDLEGPWPWGDSTVEHIQADDILEHLQGRIHVMNEAWRVLRHGGSFRITVPSALGAGFWQDPTHVSGWVMNSFQYFEAGSFAVGRLGDAYGVKARFRVRDLRMQTYKDQHEPVPKIHALLEAVK